MCVCMCARVRVKCVLMLLQTSELSRKETRGEGNKAAALEAILLVNRNENKM